MTSGAIAAWHGSRSDRLFQFQVLGVAEVGVAVSG
jgi:hypothetical protein